MKYSGRTKACVRLKSIFVLHLFPLKSKFLNYHVQWMRLPRRGRMIYGKSFSSLIHLVHTRLKVINRNDAAAICFCSGDESTKTRPDKEVFYLLYMMIVYNIFIRWRAEPPHKGRLELRVIKGLHWHHTQFCWRHPACFLNLMSQGVKYAPTSSRKKCGTSCVPKTLTRIFLTHQVVYIKK